MDGENQVDGRRASVTVDMDKACRVCGCKGAINKTGACLKCTGAAMAAAGYDAPAGVTEGENGRSPALAAVQAGEVREVPWPRLKRITALRAERVAAGWVGAMGAWTVKDLAALPSDEAARGGWCGRNPLEDFGGARDGEVNAGLVVFARKPPAGLVRATLERRLADWHREYGFEAGKAVRGAIKAEVVDALTKAAQWEPRLNRVLLPAELEPGGMVFTDAAGDNAVDAVLCGLARVGIRARGVQPHLLMLEHAPEPGKLARSTWCGERGTDYGSEFLTWLAWRIDSAGPLSAAAAGAGKFGLDTPFVTVGLTSREEIKSGGCLGDLRASLSGGRDLTRMKINVWPVKLTVDAGLRIAAVKFMGDEPEGACRSASLAWSKLRELFGRYAEERASAERWAESDRAIGEWIGGGRR